MNIRILLHTSLALFAACVLAGGAVAAAAPEAAGALPVPPLRLPTPISRTLPNGLRVVVFQQSRLPLVQVQLVVPAGFAQEPDSLPGLAALTAEFLRHGTASRTVAQLDDEMSRTGSVFSAWTGRDYALLQFASPAQALEPMLELMSDVAINPLFGNDGFATDLAAYGRKLDVQRQSLPEFADQRAADAAFAPHPYAHSPGSDIPLILAARQAELQAFHRDHWRPDRAVLAIAGDVTPERAFALATDWFGGWSGHAVPDRSRPAPRPLTGVRVVDVPGITRIEVRAALLGPGVAQPGFAAWSLAQGALEAGGLPPGVRSSLVPARDASLILLSSATSLAQAPAQAKRMTDALKTFAAAPPSGDALAAVRRRVAQSYPLGLETLGAFLGAWQQDVAAGLPGDEVGKAGAHAAAADLATVLPQLGATPVLLLVGPADALRSGLAPLGPVEVVQPDVVHAELPDTLPAATPAQASRGRATIAAAVAAHGGAKLLAGVHILVTEGDELIYRGDRELPSIFSHARVEPDHFSVVNKVFDVESRQVMVGNKGWSILTSDTTLASPIDSAGIATLKLIFHSDLVHVLLTASGPTADPAWRGTEEINGRACDLVDFAGPRGRERLAIDSATHRVLAIDGQLGPGPAFHERRLFTDYRPVSGILLPFVEDRTVDGARNSHVIVRRNLINANIDMHLFNPPPELHR